MTVSKPMYAKNTSAAPAITPLAPSGNAGVKCAGETAPKSATTKTISAMTWIATKSVLVRVDSRMPIASRAEIPSTARIASASICECAMSMPPCTNTTFATRSAGGSVT